MSTFNEWSAVAKANERIRKLNSKKLFWSTTIKMAVLSPFLFFALVILNSYSGDDPESILSYSGTIVLFTGALMIALVTPQLFKLEELKDEEPYLETWATSHGLDLEGELPSMDRFLDRYYTEHLFTQRFGNVLNTYRLVNEKGQGVLYDAKGNVVEEDLSLVKVAEKPAAEDPNADLWKVAAEKNSAAV